MEHGTVYFSKSFDYLVWYSFHVYTWHNLLELEPLHSCMYISTQYTQVPC